MISSQIVLPDRLLELRSILPEMIRYLEERLPYAAALVVQEAGSSLRIDYKHEEFSEKTPRRGIVFTLFNGRFFQEWASDRLDIDYLWDKVRHIRRLLDDAPVAEPRFSVHPGEPARAHFTTPFEIDPDQVSLEDMVRACHDLIDQVSRMDSKLVNIHVSYDDGKEYRVFVNRSKVLSCCLTLCNIRLVCAGFHHGVTRLNQMGAGGVTGFEAIHFQEERLREMIDDLNLLFESTPLTPGRYHVVSSPEVSGILAHEAFGHGVEADMYVKGRAKAAEFMGKRVASPLVNMVDDPSISGLYGTYYFDDEGQLAAPTIIIRNGILERSLTDLRSAAVLGLPRTANGRRESFERKVYARMSNTYFDKGVDSFEDMIASIDHGLYLKKSSSGMEDPRGWGIQVGIDLAHEIKGGRLTSKVYAPMTITGYVPEVLESITMVGDELGFLGPGGMCGKGHKEMVRVSAGGPHLRFTARLG
ncbi:TldD/PmbA family protein [bacterium]|nr:TldD/PmbA family protein [candidate division CSSED10-310 bacterium]